MTISEQTLQTNWVDTHTHIYIYTDVNRRKKNEEPAQLETRCRSHWVITVSRAHLFLSSCKLRCLLLCVVVVDRALCLAVVYVGWCDIPMLVIFPASFIQFISFSSFSPLYRVPLRQWNRISKHLGIVNRAALVSLGSKWEPHTWQSGIQLFEFKCLCMCVCVCANKR